MLYLVIHLAVFIGAMVWLKKNGFDQPTMDIMFAGMSGIYCLENVSKLVIAIISMNPGLIVLSLVLAILQGFFFNLFIKRAGV